MSACGSVDSLSTADHDEPSRRRPYRSQLPLTCADQITHGRPFLSRAIRARKMSPGSAFTFCGASHEEPLKRRTKMSLALSLMDPWKVIQAAHTSPSDPLSMVA